MLKSKKNMCAVDRTHTLEGTLLMTLVLHEIESPLVRVTFFCFRHGVVTLCSVWYVVYTTCSRFRILISIGEIERSVWCQKLCHAFKRKTKMLFWFGAWPRRSSSPECKNYWLAQVTKINFKMHICIFHSFLLEKC